MGPTEGHPATLFNRGSVEEAPGPQLGATGVMGATGPIIIVQEKKDSIWARWVQAEKETNIRIFEYSKIRIKKKLPPQVGRGTVRQGGGGGPGDADCASGAGTSALSRSIQFTIVGMG